MNYTNKDFEVNENLQKALPADSDDERTGLFEDLDNNGLTDPLIIGVFPDGKKYLLDGHNRYDWLKEHPDAEFETKEIEMHDMYEATEWICNRQLHRRNLLPVQQSEILTQLCKVRQLAKENQEIERDENGRFTRSPQSVENGESNPYGVVGEIAEEQGVSHTTVERAIERSHGLDIADEVSPGFKDKALKGEIKIPLDLISQLDDVSEDVLPSVVEAMENGNKKEAQRLITDDYLDSAVEYARENDPNFDETILDTPTLGENATFRCTMEDAVNNLRDVLNAQLTARNLKLEEDREFALNLLDDVTDIIEDGRTKIVNYEYKYEPEESESE